jgi:hypothetical protein
MPRVSFSPEVMFTVWTSHMAFASGVRFAADCGAAHPSGGVAARRVPLPTVRLSLQ